MCVILNTTYTFCQHIRRERHITCSNDLKCGFKAEENHLDKPCPTCWAEASNIRADGSSKKRDKQINAWGDMRPGEEWQVDVENDGRMKWIRKDGGEGRSDWVEVVDDDGGEWEIVDVSEGGEGVEGGGVDGKRA